MRRRVREDNGDMADDFDLEMMRRAMALAQTAAEAGEAPIGAVVVDPVTRQIVAEAYNEPIRLSDPTGHAEILALRSAAAKLENYRLEGVALRMRCPFYCIHGQNDNIVPLEFAQKLHEAVGSQDKTLKVLTAFDGGSEHCQEDNRQVGVNLVADWLAERLGGRVA